MRIHSNARWPLVAQVLYKVRYDARPTGDDLVDFFIIVFREVPQRQMVRTLEFPQELRELDVLLVLSRSNVILLVRPMCNYQEYARHSERTDKK
jgi:hypothetical protein